MTCNHVFELTNRRVAERARGVPTALHGNETRARLLRGHCQTPIAENEFQQVVSKKGFLARQFSLAHRVLDGAYG